MTPRRSLTLDDFRGALASRIGPDDPPRAGTRPAAVLIVIYGSDPRILMTKKSAGLRIHAGEVAFPGGKPDAGDPGLLYTALRESREELGLDIPASRVVGRLDPVATLNSNFTIAPFVAILDVVPSVRPNREVELVLRIPAEGLLRTLRDDTDPAHNAVQGMYALAFGDHVVWGASARMLKQIADRLAAPVPS